MNAISVLYQLVGGGILLLKKKTFLSIISRFTVWEYKKNVYVLLGVSRQTFALTKVVPINLPFFRSVRFPFSVMPFLFLFLFLL